MQSSIVNEDNIVSDTVPVFFRVMAQPDLAETWKFYMQNGWKRDIRSAKYGKLI